MLETQSSDQSTNSNREHDKKDPTLATLGSIIVPGFADFYVDRPAPGLIWTAFIYILYITILSEQFWLVIPGVLIHLLLIYKASDRVNSYNHGEDPLYPDIDYEENVE